MTLEPGRVVGGAYRIVRPLSAGAMGAVYVAEQLSTRKERALKVMRAELTSLVKLRERFVQEAQVGAHIDSEHVVEVIDAGVDERAGIPWLAMELLKGETLTQRIARGGPLDAPALLDLYAQLCHAVAAAHEAGIVHRDLKPDNLFLATSRREGGTFVLKVLDFGIAKLLSEASTLATGAIGTPFFMPPEQMSAGRSITPAADVWAMGLIAFYALTGKHYWLAGNQRGATPAMLMDEILTLPTPSASLRAAEIGAGPLPRGFDAWFERCIARPIEARFSNARELGRALEAALAPTTAQPVAPSAVVRSNTAPSRSTRWRWLAALGVLTSSFLVAGVWALISSKAPRTPKPVAKSVVVATSEPSATTPSVVASPVGIGSANTVASPEAPPAATPGPTPSATPSPTPTTPPAARDPGRCRCTPRTRECCGRRTR